MADYLYADDGKIHTRFSELMRCTAGQIDRVIAERTGHARVETEGMMWGTDRHDMWKTEAERTGLTPYCFREAFEPVPVSHIEEEFATEMLPGVIVHSRPDAVCEGPALIADYKTLVADSLQEGIIRAHTTYGRSRQLPFYGFQVGMHSIRIRRVAYLVEIWDRNYQNILGYTVVEKELPMSAMAVHLPWIKERIAMLAHALEGATI
jgi:hypothetical protein